MSAHFAPFKSADRDPRLGPVLSFSFPPPLPAVYHAGMAPMNLTWLCLTGLLIAIYAIAKVIRWLVLRDTRRSE